MLRFVPFVGVPVAALFALLLALGAAPGWTLALSTLAAFAAIELFVAHAVEPRLYGHATGLSPLAIVLAAVFWWQSLGPGRGADRHATHAVLMTAGRHFSNP